MSKATKSTKSKNFYIPLCGKDNCNGVLWIKKINENFSLDFECEKNEGHKRNNIFFKTFERFYLKEKEIYKCNKCKSDSITCKCRVCQKIYCSSCSIYDEHIKENNENSIIINNIQKCLEHNYQKNNYCINCKEYLCETCAENAEHNKHTVKELFNEMPTKNQINEMKNRIKHYDKLINLINECTKDTLQDFYQKIENLKQNILNEKNMIQKLIQHFNTNYMNYYYLLNFQTLYEYTKSFNNDALEEFYLEKSLKNKNNLLMKYFTEKQDNINNDNIPITNSYLKKILDKSWKQKILEKINDNLYICASNKNIKLKKYDKEKNQLITIKESKIPSYNLINDIFCEKKEEELYRLYASLKIEKKVIIFDCDINKKILIKNEDEIFYEDKDLSQPFIKCIVLSKTGYIATATNNNISIWIKNNTSKGYLHVKYLDFNSQIYDILPINENYFIASKPNKIVFYNIKQLSDDKTITTDCINSINSLFLFGKYIIAICEKGIALILIKTQEIIHYIQNEENYICKNICLYNNKIYVLNEITSLNEKINIIEYDIIEGFFQPIKKILPYNKEINNYKNCVFKMIFLSNEKILVLGNNLYELNIFTPLKCVLKKSHITESGRCVKFC